MVTLTRLFLSSKNKKKKDVNEPLGPYMMENLLKKNKRTCMYIYSGVKSTWRGEEDRLGSSACLWRGEGGVIMRRSDLDHQLFALVGRGVVVWQVRGEVRTDFDHLYAFGGEGGGVVLWPIHGEVRRTDLDPWLAFGGGGGGDCCLASTWRGEDRLGSSVCLW